MRHPGASSVRPGAFLVLPGLVGLALVAPPAAAQVPPSATATLVADPPRVDGRLDDRAWAAAERLTGFVQREPLEGTPVSQRTEVRILTDGEALYVGAWLFDETPSAIVFGQTRRDAALNDSDAFSFILDTYRDRQNGFVFATTPAGIEYDGQVANEGQGGRGVAVGSSEVRRAASTSTGTRAGRSPRTPTRRAGTPSSASRSPRSDTDRAARRRGG